MLDNDNVMTAKASEVLQKVPTDEKDYHKCSLCVIDYHKCSLCVKAHPANQKKNNNRRHFKICTEKGAITGP